VHLTAADDGSGSNSLLTAAVLSKRHGRTYDEGRISWGGRPERVFVFFLGLSQAFLPPSCSKHPAKVGRSPSGRSASPIRGNQRKAHREAAGVTQSSAQRFGRILLLKLPAGQLLILAVAVDVVGDREALQLELDDR
jgi:hypothetical protein